MPSERWTAPNRQFGMLLAAVSVHQQVCICTLSSLLEPYPFNIFEQLPYPFSRGGARVAYFLLLYDSFIPTAKITSVSFYHHKYLSDESISPIQCFMQLKFRNQLLVLYL
jgi:hypothetical protein